MAKKTKSYDDFHDEPNHRDRKIIDELGATILSNDLRFNEEENSFEYDVESDDPDYDHPDPYDTYAPNGEDDNSDWDEANPYIGAEYDKNASFESDVSKLGMHIDDGAMVELSTEDEELAENPVDEEEAEDLDNEGYPKNSN